MKGRYPKKPRFEYIYPIETEQEYSLSYSLLSSYACYLFEPMIKNQRVNPFHWKGLVHPFTGLELIQTSPKNVYLCSDIPFSPTIAEYVKDSIGLWNVHMGPSSPGSITKLITLYPGLRVPRLRENRLDILIAILCSQHTKVANGRKWFLFLKSYYRRIPPLLKMNPYEIMKESKKVSGGSMGYRARYISEMLLDLIDNESIPEEKLKRITENRNVEQARRKLINIRSIGPKTADCFLLNSLGEVSIPPIDVNVKRVCERLKFIPAGMRLPQLNYCRRYLCDEGSESCIYYMTTKEILENGRNVHTGCVRAALKIKFKQAGWIQALLFLFGIEFCRPRVPLCEECFLKEFCEGPELPIRLRIHIRRRSIRNFRKAFTRLGKFPPLLELYPEEKEHVHTDARKIFEQSTKERIKGYKGPTMAASYWIAARRRGIPLTLKETCYHFDIDKRNLFKHIKRIKRGLSISLRVLGPQDYVFPIAKKLGLEIGITKRAKEIASLYDAPGHSPIGIAAASIYLSAWENEHAVSLRNVSEVAGVTEVTLRKKTIALSCRIKKSEN